MSRTKYSADERREIIASFVSATSDLIDENGIKNVSIRKIASRAGYSSATMYLYFTDLEELLIMACVSHLKEYLQELASTDYEWQGAEFTYNHIWKLFLKHSFPKASIFLNLYFSEHSQHINDLFKLYYSVFPEELSKVSGNVLQMIIAGNLPERNMSILEPYALSLGYSKEEAILLNEITVAYYHSFLIDIRDNELEGKNCDELIEKFMIGLDFLMKKQLN